jgi:hypothetical protein
MDTIDSKLILQVEIDYEKLADILARKLNGTDPVYEDNDELKTSTAAKVIGKSVSCLRNWQKMHKYLPFYINKETLEITYKYRDLRLYNEHKNRISANG